MHFDHPMLDCNFLLWWNKGLKILLLITPLFYCCSSAPWATAPPCTQPLTRKDLLHWCSIYRVPAIRQHIRATMLKGLLLMWGSWFIILLSDSRCCTIQAIIYYDTCWVVRGRVVTQRLVMLITSYICHTVNSPMKTIYKKKKTTELLFFSFSSRKC